MEKIYINGKYDAEFLRDRATEVTTITIPSDAETWDGFLLLDACNNVREFIIENNEKYSFSDGVLYTTIGDKREITYVTNDVTKLFIPADITDIRSSVRMRNLESIDIDEDNFSFMMNDNLLIGQTGTVLYSILSNSTEAIIPEGIAKINYNAFVGCKSLKRIVIPESYDWMSPTSGSNWDMSDVQKDVNVEIEGPRGAFYNGLIIKDWGKPYAQPAAYVGDPNKCIIPENVESEMFFNYGLDTVNYFEISEHNEHFASCDGVITDKNGSKIIYYPRTRDVFEIPNTVRIIGKGSCSGNNMLNEVEIPEYVDSIELHAFSNCNNLKKVVIDNKEIIVDENAFRGCPLEVVDGVKYAGIFAEDIDCQFPGTLKLRAGTREMRGESGPNRPTSLSDVEIYSESLSFPESLKSIKKLNYPLKRIEVDDKNTTFKSKDGVLFSYDMKTLIRYPEMHDGDCYAVPDGITVISDQAFHNCHSLTDVVLPDSIEKIGVEAFSYTMLESIELPAKKIRVENLAITPSLYGRSGLKTNIVETKMLFRYENIKIPVVLKENWNHNVNERDLALFIDSDIANKKAIYNTMKNADYKRFMALYLYFVYGDEEVLGYLNRIKNKIIDNDLYSGIANKLYH